MCMQVEAFFSEVDDEVIHLSWMPSYIHHEIGYLIRQPYRLGCQMLTASCNARELVFKHSNSEDG